MSIQQQFEAAVKVIQNLPKNGPYQPSNEMMLQFYSYYKQATQGPCDLPKPSFWDVINKAKWNAWSSLGQMTKEQAMQLYVVEIKKIIETMSLSTDVEQLLEVLGPFYEYVKEGEEEVNEQNGMQALIGHFTGKVDEEKLNLFTSKASQLSDQIDLTRQLFVQDESNLGLQISRFSPEPVLGNTKLGPEKSEFDATVAEFVPFVADANFGPDDELSEEEDDSSEELTEILMCGAQPNTSRFGKDLDLSDDDLFEDPLEEIPIKHQLSNPMPAAIDLEQLKSFQTHTEVPYNLTSKEMHQITTLQSQMSVTVERLQQDMKHVIARMDTIEKLASITSRQKKEIPPKHSSSGIPFSELSGPTTLLLIIWPFAVQGIIALIKSSAKKS